VSDAAGDVQEQVDAINAQGYLGFRADPYPDESYTLTTVEDAPSLPPDDRTPVHQPPAETGAVVAPDPHIDSITPTSAPLGMWADLDIIGSNFEATSVVEVDIGDGDGGRPRGTTTFIDAGHLSLGYTVFGGPQQLTVRNESGMESNSVTVTGT
jgi:hypothetical protein